MQDTGDKGKHPRLLILVHCVVDLSFFAGSDGSHSMLGFPILAATAVSPSLSTHTFHANPIAKLRFALDLRSGGEWVTRPFRQTRYSHFYRTIRDAISLKRAISTVWGDEFDAFIEDEVAEYVSFYFMPDEIISICFNRWIAAAGPPA